MRAEKKEGRMRRRIRDEGEERRMRREGDKRQQGKRTPTFHVL